MTVKKSKSNAHHSDILSLSHAVGDFYRACLSFPTPGDVTWKMRHPQHRDPKNKKKVA